MKKPLNKKVVLRSIAVAVTAVVIVFALLVWLEFLFPIHYVKPYYPNEVEEGYHVRINWSTWSKEGKWKLSTIDGRIHIEGNYHNNHEVGVWKIWDSPGILAKTYEYDDNGQLLQTTDYEKGAVKTIEKFKHDKNGEYVGKYVTENGVTKYVKFVLNSATIWDSNNRERNNEIEEAYKNKVREGATEEEAREFVIREYNL
jgi:antitoxin component YwqK of YwqJK toxin-antitoxin module